MESLENYCDCSGPPGFKRELTLLMKECLAICSNKTYNDKLGSLFFERVGDKTGLTMLIPVHVDEIGFIIAAICKRAAKHQKI